MVAKLTVVGAEQGLVQSRALEGDGGQELLLADPGDIDDLLDPGKTEGVAADAIGVQQCQFATATARRHHLVQRSVARLVVHDQRQRARHVPWPAQGTGDKAAPRPPACPPWPSGAAACRRCRSGRLAAHRSL